MKFQYPSDIRNMPPPEWIFHELLQKNSTALLYGPSNLGKSFLALEMLFALATQRDDVLKPVSQGRALYICGEGLAGLSVRLAAWEKSRGVKLPENNPVFVGGTVQLADPKSRRQFVTAIRKEFGEDLPVLIIFDTLARCIVGLDENSARDMGMVVDGLEVVRQELRCTMLPVHHSTKQDPKTERGSGAIFGAVDTALCLRRDGSFLELTCPKQKNGHRAPPLRLDLAKQHGSCVLDTNIKKKAEDQTAHLRAVLTEPGAKKAILPKSSYIREMFPPRPWEWDGEAPRLRSGGDWGAGARRADRTGRPVLQGVAGGRPAAAPAELHRPSERQPLRLRVRVPRVLGGWRGAAGGDSGGASAATGGPAGRTGRTLSGDRGPGRGVVDVGRVRDGNFAGRRDAVV